MYVRHKSASVQPSFIIVVNKLIIFPEYTQLPAKKTTLRTFAHSLAMATAKRSPSKHDVAYLLNKPSTMESSLTPAELRMLRNTCSTCGHCFAQSADLRKHIRTVHEGQRPFACDLCSKRFGEKGNLRKHRRSVHLNERPFQCTNANCGASFAFKDGLARHIKLVHNNVRPFSCNRCGMSYKQVSQLRRHAVTCVSRE